MGGHFFLGSSAIIIIIYEADVLYYVWTADDKDEADSTPVSLCTQLTQSLTSLPSNSGL